MTPKATPMATAKGYGTAIMRAKRWSQSAALTEIGRRTVRQTG
jgi:hypothetical protein